MSYAWQAKPKQRRRLFWWLLLAAAMIATFSVVAGLLFHETEPKPPVYPEVKEPPLVFEGPSEKLQATVVVPTLQTPLPDNKSAVWCASLALAWKEMEKQVTRQPVQLQGAEILAGQLNAEPDPGLNPEHCYAAAGLVKDGILDRIRREMGAKFPDAKLALPEVGDGAVAYGYLQANVPYQHRYPELTEPLEFTDSRGNKTKVHGFGFPSTATATALRWQLSVLFREGSDFALDLSRETQPYQVIVARMPRQETLAATLADLDRRIAKARDQKKTTTFPEDGILSVPTMHWKVEHHFPELEGRVLQNTALRGFPLQRVMQHIHFKLDRRGASVTSGSSVLYYNGDDDYRLNRPFLVVLKKRDGQHPFFIMWVDNAELLVKP